MEIIASLLIGAILGSVITYYTLQKSHQQIIIREYESKIRHLRDRHQRDIKVATNRSLDGSRAVIKGKIAEQLAPVLPNFQYLPSDAKFIGDPIDYIVFNGYTELKDNGGSESKLEIVILDIKTGQSSLSQFQQAIARTIDAGRVRFEVVRPEMSAQQLANTYHPSQTNFPNKNYIEDVRKTYSRAYETWSRGEDEQLSKRYQEGETINSLAIEFHRQPGGIRSRLKKLGLLE